MELNERGLGASQNHGTSNALKSAKSGTKLKRRFTAVALRVNLTELKKYLALGHPDHVIQHDLELSVITYNELKRELYRQETASMYSATTEDVYLEYKWKQDQCVHELDEMINSFKETKQYNAMVGAVRTKSDIIDKIIKTGQEMGVIDKAPEKKLIVHGVAVATMDNVQLRKLIANEMNGLSSVVQKFGDTDLMGKPIISGDQPISPVPRNLIPELPPVPDFSDRRAPAQASTVGKAAAGRAGRAVKRVRQVDVASEDS